MTKQGEEMKARLNACLTDELRVLDVYEAKTKLTTVAYASYHYELSPKEDGEALFAKVREIFRSPVILKKKTKSGEKEIDILPLIRSLSIEYDPTTGTVQMDALLSAAGESYLNPEYLVTAMKAKTDFLNETSDGTYRILRTGMYLEDGKTAFQ